MPINSSDLIGCRAAEIGYTPRRTRSLVLFSTTSSTDFLPADLDVQAVMVTLSKVKEVLKR